MTDDEKSPPKQTRLGWGTLKMVGWATRLRFCSTARPKASKVVVTPAAHTILTYMLLLFHGAAAASIAVATPAAVMGRPAAS